MSETPMVSVLMTAYNREKYIAEAIESVIASTYTNFELIIVDDCSTDKTIEIACAYETNDQRITVYVNETNLGDYPNRNKAASLAKGKYLKYVDSDDRIFEHTLQVMVSSLENNPNVVLAISSRYTDRPPDGQTYVYTSTEALRTHFFDFGFLDNGPSFSFIKRSYFEEIGGFGTKRNVSDFELWLRIALENHIIVLPNNLVFWREHDGQEFNVASDSYIEYTYNVIRNVVESSKFPLSKNEKMLILRKYKRYTIISIVKKLIRNRNITRFTELLRLNGLGLKDFIVLMH